MNHFVFIAPMFNASATLPRMLHSLYGQSYDNWSLILIDDVSSDDHRLKCEQTLRVFDHLQGRILVIWNQIKRWEMANVLAGIKMCEDDDIVCRIDADDCLSDLDALAMLNAAYAQVDCDVLWSQHRWSLSDKNISGPLTEGADPYKHPWVTSHLKTFRKKLINNLPYENFVNQDGELVKRAGDQALYLPVLARATKRFFLPRVLYHYTIDEQGGAVYQTEDAKFQKAEADFIRHRGLVTSGTPWESVIADNL